MQFGKEQRQRAYYGSGEDSMHKSLHDTVARQKFTPISSHEPLDQELRDSIEKLEHRSEILNAISRDQQSSGRYEVAEAYNRQAHQSKTYVRSIRKLLCD
jgi:hypothetical protein